MNENDIRLLKHYRKLFIGERVEFKFWGEIHEKKHFTGGLWFDSFDKIMSNPGWVQGVRYTLQIDYDCLKIHCYSNGNYKELIIPYKSIEKVIIGKNKVIQMINGDDNITIKIKNWDEETIKNLGWYLTWANRAAIEGISFDDKEEIEKRNRRIRKNRIKEGKKTENQDFILGILFIVVIIGIIIAVINQLIAG